MRYITDEITFVNRKNLDMNITQLNLETIPAPEPKTISGLKYIPDYIKIDEQNQLLDIIDQQEWAIESFESKRRLQQHGFRYEYENGILVASTYLGRLPDWASSIATRLYEDSLTAKVLDQATVNEYYPGQGLRGHVDCTTCFGNIIVTVSLGGYCVMDFTHSQTQEKTQFLLEPGSLLILQGESRYVWYHSVTAREVDTYQGREFVRTRRVSLTLREALFPHK